MSFWQKKPDDPAQDVKDRVKKLERENESAVKMDHRFGAIGVLTIAIAALIGMAAESVQALLRGAISQSDLIQLATAFAAVVVMNRGLLAAARNIRRAEGRGENPRPRDVITMYGVMAVESISFGYMLWIFEGKPNMFSVPGLLLAARACILPYATVYLEQQRQQPPDPVDIGIQAEIGQGLGVMGALVEQAYDRDIPTALKLGNYRANATLTPAMDARLGRMTDAAQAYDHYKKTGEIVLPNQAKKPDLPPSDTECDIDATDLLADPADSDEPNAAQGAFRYHAESPELRAYVLPEGFTLTLQGSIKDIAKGLGARPQGIAEGMQVSGMAYMPAIAGQPHNAHNVACWQVLALVEAHLLDMPTNVTRRTLQAVQ